MNHKEKIRQGIIGAVLVLFAFVTVFPIYFLAVNSFKGQQEMSLLRSHCRNHGILAILQMLQSRLTLAGVWFRQF